MLDAVDTKFAASVEAAGARVATSDAGIDAVIAPGGKAIAWRRPVHTDPDSAEYAVACRAATTFVRTYADLQRIADDPRLSDTAKVEDAEALMRKALADAEAVANDAQRIIAAFEEADRAEAGAPALPPGDAAAESRDFERRNWVRGLSDAERVRLVRAIADGDNEALQVAYAIYRAPVRREFAGVLAEGLDAAVADAIARRDPETARMRRQARARIDHLRNVVAQVNAAMPRPRQTIDDAKRAALAAADAR